jgi:hypothetical protein
MYFARYKQQSKAQLVLKEGVTPVFSKAYDPPYVLRAILEAEVNKLVNAGILKPVNHSQCATLVLLLKFIPYGNGLYGSCQFHDKIGQLHQFNSSMNCQVFSVIDLATAYQQINLHPLCCQLLATNNHKGLLEY